MAIFTVGPNSTFPTIAAAMAAAGPGDIISLEAGYSNETVTVLHSGMTIDGGADSLGIVLELGNGIATVALVGTAPIDVRDAGDGNGIVGNDGDNVITVTAGADAVSGGAGHDRLFVDYRLATGAITGNSTSNVAEAGGGARLVTINGGFEDFTIWTGSGADTITTGAGDDDIRTGEGASTVTAGEGANHIVGGSGADTVTAGSGGNFIDGGDGVNTITSGGGADEILSGSGDDTIVAGAGDDGTTVTGGADTVDSGMGDDLLTVDYSASSTAVVGGVTGGTLLGGYSGHIADLAGATVDFVTTERFSITTGSGDDVLATGDYDDVFMTGAGDDTIDGGGGEDTLRLSGNRADYDVTDNGDGTYTIVDLRDGSPDDTDIVTNIEFLTFADGTFGIDAPMNDAPVAGDDVLDAIEDAPITYAAADLLGNDTDGDLDTLAIAGVSNVTGGAAVLNANGTVTFTPTANFNGDAGFDYEVSDGNGGTDTGHAAIAVAAVNDAPVNVRPGAQPINEDNAVTFNTGSGNAISVSDVDVGAGSLTVTLSIQSGALTLSGTAGLVVSGDASNLVTLTGSGAAINTALNGLVYAPPANSSGSRTLTITTSDNGNVGTDPGGDPGSEQDVDTVTINIGAVDDAAVARTDAVTTNEAATLSGNVLADNGSGVDSDVDGPLTISAVNGSAANVGTQIALLSGALLTLNADGTFLYDPGHMFDATPAPDSGASNMPALDSFSYTLAGGGTAIVTVSIAGIDGDDTLLGTAGADDLNGGIGRDYLDGGAGADLMAGGAGNDTYWIDDAGDIVTEALGAGQDIVFARGSYTLTAGAEVEVLAAGAAGALDLIGNELANAVYGNDGANVLIGGGGDDVLEGFGGADTLTGASGDDYLDGGAGDDRLEGLGGADTLRGGLGDDYLDGGAGADLLIGGGGEDVIEGFGGNDTLYGGSDSDDLDGGADDDALEGFAGADSLRGGLGDDYLDGGAGADLMTGGGGNDIYWVDDAGDAVTEAAGEGGDIVFARSSYTLGADADIEVLAAGSADALDLVGNDLANAVYGNNAANWLDGMDGDDVLAGFGGADTYAFTSALGLGNVDRVLGFETGVDKIALDDSMFAGLDLGALPDGAFCAGATAADADDRILYDVNTGALSFDADGNGAGAAVQFAALDSGLILSASDFMVI